LYERRLNRSLDEASRLAIEAEYHRRKSEIPIATQFAWHPSRPELTIRSSMVSFIVEFTQDDRMIVNAEMGFAARMLATQQNRGDAVRFIDSIVADLGL